MFSTRSGSRSGGALFHGVLVVGLFLEHIDRVVFHETARGVTLDPATRRNLELERNLRDGTRNGSLIDALDATLTPGGGRLLRRWLFAPLLDPAEVNLRLDAVQEFVTKMNKELATEEEPKARFTSERRRRIFS